MALSQTFIFTLQFKLNVVHTLVKTEPTSKENGKTQQHALKKSKKFTKYSYRIN